MSRRRPKNSLTPHMDVALKAIAGSERIVREQGGFARDDYEGVLTRIQLAMNKAYIMAMAIERERGTSDMDIYAAFVHVLSDVQVGVLMSTFGSDIPPAKRKMVIAEQLRLIGDKSCRLLDDIEHNRGLALETSRYEYEAPERTGKA